MIDVMLSWKEFLLIALIATFLSIILMILVKLVGGPIVWLTVIAQTACFFFIAGICLSESNRLNTIASE